MSVQRELRGITPLLQAELTKQLGKVTDAIDDDDLLRAWRCLKTLVTISPPKVKKECTSELDRIDKQIQNAQQQDGVDIYQKRQNRRKTVRHTLRMEVRPLFNKVMNLLYEGGYLEQYRTPVPSNVPDQFFAQATP